MPRKYQPKFILGQPNPLYIPQKNRHPKKGEAGFKSHSGSDEKTHFESGKFIGWDGEGFDKADGTQVYGLFMNSLGACIHNENGLSTEDCLHLLVETARDNRNAIHVCYGASYDVNMLLRDVPRDDLVSLYKGDKIEYKRYELEYRPRKNFTVRYLPEKRADRWAQDKKGNYHKVREVSLVLWDVIGFFQGTFVKALESYSIPCDLEKIKTGKAKRGCFNAKELPFIKEYCKEEIQALVLLMKELHSNLTKANLKIGRWDGSGACASALMKREGIKEHMEESPPAVLAAAQHAYSGGRIETLRYGHHEGTVYHYDINSAYPYAMLELPSLKGGKWTRVTDISVSRLKKLLVEYPFSLYKVSWKFPEWQPFYPFSFRTTSGSILFPPQGKNWVWQPEIKAVFDSMQNAGRHVKVDEAWIFQPAAGIKPFAFVKELFTIRAQMKREGNGAEKAYKLAINSLYGKMVQQIGYKAERKGVQNKPPYHQLEWGGYVTSKTRAMIYSACVQNPTAIICIATDGIYSTSPLHQLDTGTGLGQWEAKTHDTMTIVTSGVYWYDRGEKEQSYYRGFDANSLTRENVLKSWDQHLHLYKGETWKDSQGNEQTGPKSTRFITLGAALLTNAGPKAQAEHFKLWRTWHTISRDLHLDTSSTAKRLEVLDYDQTVHPGEWGFINPSRSLILTRARAIRFLRDEELPFPDTFMIEGSEVSILSSRYKLRWEGDIKEETIDGIPVGEYERQHLDTFV